jgi:hypothetical protein
LTIADVVEKPSAFAALMLAFLAFWQNLLSHFLISSK